MSATARRDTAGSFGPLDATRADSFMRELEDELRRLRRLLMAQNIGQTGRAVTSITEVNRT